MAYTHPPAATGSGPFSDAARIKVSVSMRGNVATMELSGELDMASKGKLDAEIRAVLASDCEHVVLDLRGLGFMDSTGLRLLLQLDARSREDGFRLWIVSSEKDPIHKVLRLTGADKFLPLVYEPPELPG